jgi:DNA-binding MarR family transcriptional regulator
LKLIVKTVPFRQNQFLAKSICGKALSMERRLERTGWIARRPHAVHGRIQHIDVTEEGHALVKRCRSRVQAIEKQVLAGLSEEEERIVRRWLVSLALDSDTTSSG